MIITILVPHEHVYPSEPGSIDGVPTWMQSVSEETLYNSADATTSDDTERNPPPAADPLGMSTPDTAANESESSEGNASLSRNLSMSMVEGAPNPALQPTVVGRVRSDLNQQLEKAVSVL